MIDGKYLMDIGFPEGKVIGVTLEIIRNELAGLPEEQIIPLLINIISQPVDFLLHPQFSAIATLLVPPEPEVSSIKLTPEPLPFKIYGKEGIEEGALQQMRMAMRLPVTIAGALMPDAHQGYGLPIGGVLATENAVIPYGVGVDIGCRMCMSIFDMPDNEIFTHKKLLKKHLIENTRFGKMAFDKPMDHPIFERNEFREIPIVKQLKDRAYQQIGSSGGGNHFVEFGIVELNEPVKDVGTGRYLALLSHSGSRGLGANIARHYTTIAMDSCTLPKEARHLAWLDLNSEEGQEYWSAMNLAGDYASACHHQIHQRISTALGVNTLAMIENHHNFAWKEKDEKGRELIVHRKGATPAGKSDLGIIPGSMATPGFIVMGKGVQKSVNSASHGAGRTMSRTQAKQILNKKQVIKYLNDVGVEVIGSGIDEAPMAYKDIHEVMNHQKDLVNILGTFMPRIVRMCGDTKYHEVD